MSEINIELTDKLVELFKIPQGDRDAGWFNEFMSTVPHAALAVAEKEVQTGPDGFPYLHLLIPPEDSEFKGYTIAQVLDVCVEKGIGAVICPDVNSPPHWVFTYGNLLSFKLLGSFDARDLRAAPPPPAPAAGQRQVMVAQPNETYLPKAARESIKRYLELNKVENPSIFLMHDAAMQPPQQLVFNVFKEDFQSEEHFNQICYRLTWYLPPSYSFVTLPNKTTQLQGNFAPL